MFNVTILPLPFQQSTLTSAASVFERDDGEERENYEVQFIIKKAEISLAQRKLQSNDLIYMFVTSGISCRPFKTWDVLALNSGDQNADWDN